MSREEIQEDSFSSDEDFDEECGSESSTDVDEKLVEEEVFDMEFFKCYSALKKKDAKIYDQNLRFFNEEEQQKSGTESENDSSNEKDDVSKLSIEKKKRKSNPKMTLLDHQLKLKDEDIEDDDIIQNAKIDLNKPVSKSFYEKELEEIKKSIEKVGENIDSESDDDFLVTKGTQEHSNAATKSSNKICSMLNKLESEGDQDLEHLRKMWVDTDKLPEEEKFLRDYILNKLYLPPSSKEEDEKNSNEYFSNNIDELSDADEDDKTNKKSNVVEHRSEEKNFDKIARIPRGSTKTIRDLVEKQDKKEKRMKKVEKLKKKKKTLKNEDCEDVIAGMPTRFHYRETEPNDFGLSAEELLMATDEELENWCKLENAIKHATPEEELAMKRKFEKRRDDMELKRKIFKSIYGESEADQAPAETSTASNNETSDNQQKASGSNKRKKRKRGVNHKKFAKAGVAPDRLLAYGLSKTRLKKSKLL